jgi:hypothetical protein
MLRIQLVSFFAKMQFLKCLILFSFILISIPGYSQSSLGSITGDESELYAETKQVNQFFKRFNNEEDRFGIRYYPGDSLYRDNDFRNVYLNILFDLQNSTIKKQLKNDFIKDVTELESPIFLDFHGGLWFAEVASTFKYYGVSENLLLFLQLEDENLGSKWIITNVYFNKFLRNFYKGEEEVVDRSFLHPMSHELDFMNIYKAFKDNRYVEYYASQSFKPDYLTLLFYEIKMGNMSYENIGQLKFHFFQVDGWYFEVSYFNRSGNNSGWLISKLYKINEQDKEELIKFYLP